MKPFLSEDFLLQTPTAQRLYHEHAAGLPLIDYHCHLPPEQIAEDRVFGNLTQVWLNGDHYKWRAMRINGVNETFITGDASDREKFIKWAETVPYTLRNPLYHWTHLELQRYFGISEILNANNAQNIYERCNHLLNTDGFTARGLMTRMNVEVVCTTDDPLDSLELHKQIAASGFGIKVLPTFRPDAAMNTNDVTVLNAYIDKLEAVTNLTINNYHDYLAALKNRHNYFAEHGCRLSDHGLEHLYADDYTEQELSVVFDRIRTKQQLDNLEAAKFKSALLHQFAFWNHERGWVQQYHLGALRNNNSRRLKDLGKDTGWDSIGDFNQAVHLSRFLDRLDREDKLAKTILYNLNPADNELFATMAGNFNDGSVPGKVQFGSAWWFNDQKDGMIRQLNALSNMGLLSRLVGMLTDSRSFLSYPRHEYFRRLLCNLLADDIENGELPADIPWTGKIIQDICYYNARDFFGF